LLAGRIFFKGLRYHGQNETILVQDGYVTWQYWHRRVRHAEAVVGSEDHSDGHSSREHDASSTAEEGTQASSRRKKKTPCRILLEARGIEWFVYNRKPVYDSVLATLLKPASAPAERQEPANENPDLPTHRKGFDRSARETPDSAFAPGSNDEKYSTSDELSGGRKLDGTSSYKSRSVSSRSESPTARTSQSNNLPSFLKLLPVGLRCSRAAMVMGNEHTRSILVAKVESFDGVVDAKLAGPQDIYRQSFDFEIHDANVQFKPNQEFSELQIHRGTRLKESTRQTQTSSGGRWLPTLIASGMGHAQSVLRMLPLYSKSEASLASHAQPKHGHPQPADTQAPEEHQNRWLGLTRYLDDTDEGQIQQERWKAIEYGRFETIVDCPKVVMSFFWDVPGIVPEQDGKDGRSFNTLYSDNINRDKPPDYGLEVEIGGGSINYGPWADRQRANLQAVFFPASYAMLQPALPLKTGQFRVSTAFKIVIILREDVTVRLHIREESKDWRWKDHLNRADQPKGKRKHKTKKNESATADPEVRPAGWLDLVVGANTAVTYNMDMVPGRNGYRNGLEMDIRNTQMSSSINHDLMWRCKRGELSCSLPNPLSWNELRKWCFDIMIDSFELFIIRDHAFLLTDLVSDWTAGPPGEFFTFVSFLYTLRLNMPNFKVYLNVNDSNIIDNPASLEDNAFLVLWGDALTAEVGIPIKEFRPSRSKVTFDVDVSRGGLQFSGPLGSTQRTFLESKDVGSFHGIALRGSYNYCTMTSPTLTDTVLLDVHGYSPSVLLYGFLIRYFLNFKENYFGDDLHFQTQEEYSQRLGPSNEPKNTGQEKAPPKVTNDLDVILTVAAEGGSFLVPANIYSAKEHIKVDIADLSVDLRFTNYYMDLQVDFSPLALTRGQFKVGEHASLSVDSGTQAFVNGVSIAGHRLFGLPPTEPTYVCNWDFSVGQTAGECSFEFLACAIGAARSFALSFPDVENALPPRDPIILNDITLLRASVAPIKLWLHTGSAAFLLQTDGITVTFNDWAGQRFSERLHVSIPRVIAACVDGRASSRQRLRPGAKVATYAYISSSADVRLVQSKADFEVERQKQQDHIALHDSRTNRTPWLIHDKEVLGPSRLHELLTKARPPASPFPPMPGPVRTVDDISQTVSSSGSSTSRPLSRKLSSSTSFLPKQSTSRRQSPTVQSRRGSSTKRYPTQKEDKTVEEKHSPHPRHHKQAHSGFAPTSMAFSSSFELPYFPLHHVDPDTENVPHLVPETNSDHGKTRDLIGSTLQPWEGSLSRTAIIVSIEDGIRTLCTPDALFHLNTLLSNMNTTSPDSILDQLQAETISKVLEKNMAPEASGILELRVSLPAIAVRLSSEASNYSEAPERRVYDLSLQHLIVNARKGVADPATTANTTEHSTLHITLDHASCVATASSSSMLEHQTRIELYLNRSLAWLVYQDSIRAELQIEGLGFVNSNKKVERLASLVNSTLALGDTLARNLQRSASIRENRLRTLVYNLATTTQSLPDPAFLTSTPNSLRTSSLHPRNEDSWKLLSRLRHVSQSTSWRAQCDILELCSSEEQQYPSNARQQTLAGFNRWRSWDLTDAPSSFLMQAIFGPPESSAKGSLPLPAIPIFITMRTISVQIIIEPGPKQNEFSLGELGVEVRSTTSGSSRRGESPVSVQSWSASVSLSTIDLHLNWGIFDIFESILGQYVAAPALTASSAPPRLARSNDALMPWDLHLVLVVNKFSSSFETINFKGTTECMNLASSLVVKRKADQSLFAALILNCNEIQSGIANAQQSLLNCKISHPSLHGGVDSIPEQERCHKTWRLGALCHKLDIDISEDALGLLGVADLFVRDEMSHIKHIDQHIIQKLKDLQQVDDHSVPEEDPISHSIHVALLLESYFISIKLLSSLVYNIQGSSARSTVRSCDNTESKYAMDFDLLENLHGFTNYAHGTPQEVFKIALPPVNGQVSLDKQSDKIRIISYIALQQIHINASEVHALFTTLSRREISAFKDNVAKDLALVRSNWQSVSWTTITATQKQKPVPKDETTLIYRAHFAAAGLHIKATSSRTTKLSAHLSFDVGKLHADVCNEGPRHESLSFPAIEAGLEHIKVLLERTHGQNTFPVGDVAFNASLVGTSKLNDARQLTRSWEIATHEFEINVYPETASSVVDIIGYLQQRFKSFNLTEEFNTLRARRLRSRSHATPHLGPLDISENGNDVTSLFSSMYSLEVSYIQLAWHAGKVGPVSQSYEAEDLVFSISKIGLATTKANSARLMLENMQLQMVPVSRSKRARSSNSALLPEVVFNVAYLSTGKDRRLAFQAVGKLLDIRLTSQFILPAANVQKSIAIATEDLRKVIADWNATFVKEEQQSKTILGNKTLSSVLVNVDFAGAQVHVEGSKPEASAISSKVLSSGRAAQVGRQAGPSSDDNSVVLRAPGVAFKVEYKNILSEDPSINAEVKVDASSNTLHPTLVPLIMEISESVKTVVGDKQQQSPIVDPHPSPSKSEKHDPLASANPTAILGNTRLNIGLRICKQDFALTCQPIARVAATARFDDIYVTVNTVQSSDQHRFFALSAVVKSLESSVQHVYSREKTGSFMLDSINLSLINSRHVSGTEGISAILKISPMRVNVNAKQLHDFFLFREIWFPSDLFDSTSQPQEVDPVESSQFFGVQRYQQMAAASAFPWNASVTIENLDIRVDLGQSLGKASFSISDFWVSSKKSSDYQQNLCLGFKKVAVESAGRMSGFVELRAFRVQTSIQWPTHAAHETPLIEASFGFDDLRAKVAFEYQMFLVAEFSSLDFFMYNVRQRGGSADRLVCIVSGNQVHLYCTTQSASQIIGLYQAFQRLVQEKRTAYQQALRDVAAFTRRRSGTNQSTAPSTLLQDAEKAKDDENKTPLNLQTNVVISLKAVKIGAYPSTFFDTQIFKLEALDASAKFSVAFVNGLIQSGLSLQLGQVRIALSNVPSRIERKTLEDIAVEEVVRFATSSRGGTILKVPRVVVTMQTYQNLHSTQIDYVFRSSFEGKVEVGWNYSRISYIRGMWDKHSRTLAYRLGKPLPQSAVQITGGPRPEAEGSPERKDKEQEKITAVVNVPLSKYSYTALEPPVIVTPQLRDMGEATPPLEWIGLNRDKLPNLTHQIIIVPLLEVAKEVEDAYTKILGSS
jgi:hypothetical protein